MMIAIAVVIAPIRASRTSSFVMLEPLVSVAVSQTQSSIGDAQNVGNFTPVSVFFTRTSNHE